MFEYVSPKCRPCRGFLVTTGFVSHGFRRGLRCDVPSGLSATQNWSTTEGSDLLTELAGVAVDAQQVERTAEALGKQIAADERVHSEPRDALPLPQTLYLGRDGTGIALRAEELLGRTGKQPDGSAKTGEVKLCTIWSAESLDEEGIPIRDQGSVTYSAALESASALDTAA